MTLTVSVNYATATLISKSGGADIKSFERSMQSCKTPIVGPMFVVPTTVTSYIYSY